MRTAPIQWKPFWLATQFYTQNDLAENYDDCSQVLLQDCPREVSSSSKRKERGDYLDVALLVTFLVKLFGEMANFFLY